MNRISQQQLTSAIGARAYYVRRVLHDYSDENCIRDPEAPCGSYER
jgi:hypothetical protein